LPLRHRHGYAAALHRGLPTSKITDPGVPARAGGAHRNPAQIHRVRAGGGLEGLYTADSSRPPSRLACGPTPSGSPGASRRCRGCSPPGPVVSPDPAAPSFYRSAATDRRRGSHTRTRITAPRGARPLTPTRTISASRRTRRYPQVGFSVARCSANARSPAGMAGRPGERWWVVQRRATSRWCQRRIVAGVTSSPIRRWRGSRRARATVNARSAQDSRGRGALRWSTASCWRSTRISTSLAAPERVSSTIQLTRVETTR
jgi:hypothetical protein